MIYEVVWSRALINTIGGSVYSFALIRMTFLVGIAAGIKSIEVAVVLTVFFNYAALLVCAFGDGLESQHAVQEKIRQANDKARRVREKQARRDPNAPMSGL